MRSHYDKEVDRIEQELEDGIIYQKEYHRQMRQLRDQYDADADEALRFGDHRLVGEGLLLHAAAVVAAGGVEVGHDRLAFGLGECPGLLERGDPGDPAMRPAAQRAEAKDKELGAKAA